MIALLDSVVPGGEQRDLLRLAGPAVDDGAAVQPAHHANGSRLDVAQERRDDERYDSEHADEHGGDNDQHFSRL